jgi:dTDP-4-amino-4,6-dideoxygalactose transaminase
MSQKNNGVPLCDLQAQYQSLKGDLEAAALRVLASGRVILGAEVAAFEEELAEYCGAYFGIGCGSGSDALSLALHALDLEPGSEVLLPTFTFFATVGAVVRAGLKPVLVDIDPATYNIDPLQIENKVTSRSRVILPVHLFGQCAEMEPIWRIAERHGLIVIEDAAQALGSEYQGKRAGSLAGIGCLSFYPTKNLGGFGDGGMVVTSDPEWANRMRCLRVHGMEPRYYHKHLGWNARLDEVQAALLRVKLPHLDRWLEAREAVARRYDHLIAEQHLGDLLQRPVVRPRRRHTFNQYVVRVAGGLRDALVSHLKANGIGCEIYYPLPLHLQECLRFLGYGAGDFPAAEEACRSVLALPIFPEMTEDQQARVMECCAAFARMRARTAA